MTTTRRGRVQAIFVSLALLLAACTGAPTTAASGPDIDQADATPADTSSATDEVATTEAATAGPGPEDDRCWDIGFDEDGTSFDSPSAALAAQAEMFAGAPDDDDPAMATLQSALERAVADPSSTTVVSLSSARTTEVLLDDDRDGVEDVVVSLAGDDEHGYVVVNLSIAISCDGLPPGPSPTS